MNTYLKQIYYKIIYFSWAFIQRKITLSTGTLRPNLVRWEKFLEDEESFKELIITVEEDICDEDDEFSNSNPYSRKSCALVSI